MVDRPHLSELYDSVTDEELERIWRTEIVPEARGVLQAEMRRRGLSIPAPPPAGPEGREQHRWLLGLRNPYEAPASRLADPDAEAVISARGLVRLFHGMVIASTAIGVFLFTWVYLPLPISEETLALRFAGGAGALLPYAGLQILYWLLQPLWLVSAIGLYFFMWWGRWLLVATYGLSLILSLVGGMAIWFPWEGVLIGVSSMLDGAVLLLAFLPPLSHYFQRPTA